MAVKFGGKFGAMVGATMVALKLKDSYDEYSSLPNEEEGLGHGPVALRTANLDEDAPDGASLLDTTLPSGRSKRQHRADCCVCCGLRCGLFWKAFGIVCLLFLGWQAIRLVIWVAKPKETGLEGMPEFSTSLGCMDAPKLYKGGKFDVTIPVGVNQNKGDHSMDFRGGAVGTIVVAQGEADLQEVKYEITLRGSTEDLFEGVVLDYPTPEEVAQNTKSSRLQLAVPAPVTPQCARFDVTVFLPPAVKTLHIQTHATTQVKFDPDSNFNLNTLFVTFYKLSKLNMFLPIEGIHANTFMYQMSEGWLVGDVTVVNDATLNTQRGDATMNVRVHPAPSSSEPPAPVKLLTSTGAGRADVFFVNHAGFPHRPIDSTHHTSMNGKGTYLTYKKAGFNGTVDLTAKSFTATGLLNAFKQDGDLPYVGSRDGGDRMLIKSQGWVGLYF
ncbi:hypothetical protein BD311DRAFT_691403 [Dichomitus squalens]|uniref:Uncharacterized protein n=1 Tax=Dichomitus squalens TaxID=114155 RepID=A0A4Q9MVD7_9APHY|nr:hypothetical protein BD311DRAFT_691403 [Dichomitus squalens]